ncbi:hypothetical protein AB0M61_42820 [Streptomyces sp. NPDC051642]|uniref:hypothetical protein n=1 Tax=Streptomyces sp. NPDC051642 TaxID=3154646 RepID=UPI003424DEC3
MVFLAGGPGGQADTGQTDAGPPGSGNGDGTATVKATITAPGDVLVAGFRDPARNVSLTTAIVLPRPLADDMLRGTLDRLPNSRDRSASCSRPCTP